MEARMEKWLTELIGICKTPSPSFDAESQVEGTLKNVVGLFNNDAVTEDVEDLIYAALFHEEKGIFKFIQEASCQKSIFDKTICTGFALIVNLIEVNRRDSIRKYANHIEDFCWRFWMEKETASLRENALKVLISLYKNSGIKTNEFQFPIRVNKLINDLGPGKKLPARVLQQLFHLLGVLCQKYPGEIESKHDRILSIFLYRLDQQVKQKRDGSLTILKGRFEGLSAFLRNFPLKSEIEQDLLHDAIKEMVLNWSDHFKEAHRAALNLLGLHGSQFSKQLMKDYIFWNDKLWGWAISENADNSRAGNFALNKFYQVISEELKNIEADKGKAICEELIKKVQRHEYDHGFGVAGLGYLSAPAKTLCGPYMVSSLFTSVKYLIKNKFFRNEGRFHLSVRFLPVYMEAMSRITGNLDHVTLDQVVALQEVAVHLIENYPNFPQMQKHQCAEALITVTHHLISKGSLVNIFLEKVLYQGLIRSCSFPVPMDVELIKEEWKSTGPHAPKVTGCLDYVSFWQGLFKSTMPQIKGMDPFEFKNVKELLFDHFISSILVLLDRLDLSLTKEDHAGMVGNMPVGENMHRPRNEFGLASSKPKDIVIFCNLVAIITEVFPTVDIHMMDKCLNQFTMGIIDHSEKVPLISGFYKILESCLHICMSLKYFEDEENQGDSFGKGSHEFRNYEQHKLFTKLKHFLQNMLLQMKHFKGDLKLSCLQVLLATPTPIIKIILPHLVSPMKSVFEIGSSHYKIADAGIGALEKWTMELPFADWDPVLRQILPSLDSFIKIGVHHVSEPTVGPSMEKLSKASTSRRKYLVAKRRLESRGIEKDFITRYKLQRRCLLFLGQLPPSTAQAFITDDNDASSECGMAWDTQYHLSFSIPLPDMHPCIYIDKFLPRIVELSLTSSDRNTRIAACEVLHAFVMYLLGKGVQLGPANQDKLSKLVQRLVPSLLQLGCYPDDTAKSIFHKLLFSLSHWYSVNWNRKESTIWVNALMDGLCDPHNAALRELSACCLREYVERMLNAVVEGNKLPLDSIERILENICSFSLHSNQYRRIGAAMALNNLYPILKEEVSLVNQLWLELLYCQIIGMEMCDIEGSPSNWLMRSSLHHLEEVFKSEANLFNKDAKKRRKPPGFEGVLLKDLMLWLLRKIGSIGATCRRECMRLFLSLAPYVQGYSGAEQFISKMIEEHGAVSIIDICEGESNLTNKPSWISSFNPLEDKCSRKDLLLFLDWLNSLFTSLQCYGWIFENNLASPSDVFVEGGSHKALSAVTDFVFSLDSFNDDIFEALSEISLPSSNVLQDADGDMCLKPTICGVSIQIFKFLSCLHHDSLSNTYVQNLLAGFWTPSLWDLIANLIFRENMRDSYKGVTVALQRSLKSLFEVITSLPATLRDQFFTVMDRKLQKVPKSELENIHSVLTGNTLYVHMDFVTNLLFLQECSPMDKDFKWNYMNELEECNLLQCVFDTLFTNDGSEVMCVSLSHAKMKYLESLLKLSLHLNLKIEDLITLVTDEKKVEIIFSQSNLTKGEHFFTCFKPCLMSYLFLDLKSSLDSLLKHLIMDKGVTVSDSIVNIIKELLSDKRIKQRHVDNTFISSCLTCHWPSLQQLTWKDEWSSRVLDLLLAIYVGVPESIEIIHENKYITSWCVCVLTSRKYPLEKKIKALELLPCLLSHDSEGNSNLRTALRELLHQHFPPGGETVSNGQSTENTDLAMILQRLLIALEMTSCPMLLDFIINASNGGNNNLNYEYLDASLNSVVKRANTDQQLKLINAGYSAAKNDNGDDCIRLGAVKNFVNKLIKISDKNTVENFYKASINEIDQILRGVLKMSVYLKGQLVSKIVCFQLVEIMFVHLNKRLEEPSCPIVLEHKNGRVSGREMIQHLLGRCQQARKSVYLQLGGQEELLRRYRCAAYNAAIAIVANLKRETKCYKYLFQENLKAGEGIWEGLVDTSVMMHLPRSFHKEPVVVPVETPICEGVESKKRKLSWNPSLHRPVGLTTQEFLTDSTLNEDITKFDYQNCSVQSLCHTMREPNTSDSVVMEDGGTSKPTILMHEKDPANDHECMAAVTSLVKHLAIEGIFPSADNPEDFDWLNSIKEAIEYRNRHSNVKIFLVRVILNCEKELTSHAKPLMVPIMKAVANGCLGHDTNYLVSDVIQMLLVWYQKNSDISLPPIHVTALFNFFALKAEESMEHIFKEYMYIIRSMFEAWNTLIEIPYDSILDKCNIPRSEKLGLFLSRLVLEHSKLPWRPADKKRFLDCLRRIFQNGENKLRLLSAHVIGQVLRTMDPKEIGESVWTSLEEIDKEFTLSIIKNLQEMLKASQKDAFFKYMHEIQLNYSSIADEFISTLLCHLPKLQGKFHTMIMAIICSRVEKLERPFSELNDKGLQQWLKTNIPEDQQIALKMVMKILPRLEQDEILQILDSLLSFHHHSSVECRKIFFEILIWIFDNFCLKDWDSTPFECQQEVEQSWTDKCAKTLLYGLIDKDKEIQSRVCSFFEEKPGLKLSDNTTLRFVNIMDKLYSPATETSFLGYALALLLSPSASTPSYQELLFEHPLAECVFEEYQPRTSHRTLDLDMSPMFTDSFASSLTQMELNSQSQVQNSSMLCSMMRASQRSLVFSSTQGTFMSSSNAPIFLAGTSSNIDTVDGAATVLDSSLISGEKGFKRPHEIKRKRYLDKPKSRSHFAAIENLKSTQRMEMATDRMRKRDTEITLHRKFRVGDFPDIQIHCYDILEPLCAVAKRDPVIAQQLFVSLFIEIFKTGKFGGNLTMMALQGREALNTILTSTSQFSSPLISAVLEIALSRINYFPLKVDSVMKAVGPSGLSPLACLFFEARLNQWLPDTHTRLYDRSQASKNKDIWLQLAMIYRGIEEYDVVYGIFHDMMGCGPDVKKALEFERCGHWTKGKTAFNEILNTAVPSDADDTEYIERDYYLEGYFKCLASLSQWSDLNKVIMKQLGDSFSEAWSDEAFWIPWVLKSQVNCGLELESNADGYFQYIKSESIDSDQRIYLQSYYSRELAVINSMFGEYGRAGNLVRKYYDSFLEEWPHLSPLSTKIKVPKLLNTQLTSELSLFLSAMKIHESPQFNQALRRLCGIWKVNLPNHTEPLSHWEHRIACRHLFIRKMIAADVGGVTDMDDESNDLEKISGQMSLSLVNMAISAQNFHVADKYLKKTESLLRHHPDSELRLPWHISQAFLPWVKGLNNKSNRGSQLKLYVEAWDLLVDIFKDPQLSISPGLHLNVIQKICIVSKSVHGAIKMNPTDIDGFDSRIKMNILRLIEDSTPSTSSLPERITKYGINLLEKSVDIAKALSESHVAEQYLELAKYCQYLMEDTPEKHEEVCLKSILRAMAYGSHQARQWFPCILQFSGLYSTLSELFQVESSRVPTWMYLSWTSQILAHLNGSSISTLSDLVVQLAETYPSAIVFPFRVSSDKHLQENSEAMRTFTIRLEKILFKNKLLENLLESLRYVCLPTVMLKYHLSRIISLLESSNLIIEEIEKANTFMMNEAFPQSRGKRVMGPQYCGKLIHDLRDYEKDIQKNMDTFLSNKTMSQARDLGKKLKEIIKKIDSKKYQKSQDLKSYSRWLSEFRSTGRGECVEIPGQYTGDHEPSVEEHVKIFGFLPKVTVMASLRHPICLTIIGSDANEHKFLIKYGEDLRLDQRIEQLFGIMNKILAVNPATKERKLHINTYQVIPLTSHLGIIQWVDNTITMLEMLSLSMENKGIKERRAATDEYQRWLQKASKNHNNPYPDAFLKYGRGETVKSFKERVEAFPCDILRRSLLSLSLTLDSFWSLRNAFATSYATLCIAHWLLGIGDRHNSNTLVSMTTGQAIGIDFGYSFGTTTQFLPVPELMPFRMTPQIIGLMQPCGEVGLIKETMIHTLKALQETHDILLSTMDVFVKEPSVDWLDQARKQAKNSGLSVSELEGNDLTYPKKKILLTRRKFVGGTNPRVITLEELDSRKIDEKRVLSKFKEVAAGEQSCNVRATLSSLGLSCEEQVSCLLDQATDYHILGKTWEGWEPWL